MFFKMLLKFVDYHNYKSNVYYYLIESAFIAMLIAASSFTSPVRSNQYQITETTEHRNEHKNILSMINRKIDMENRRDATLTYYIRCRCVREPPPTPYSRCCCAVAAAVVVVTAAAAAILIVVVMRSDYNNVSVHPENSHSHNAHTAHNQTHKRTLAETWKIK